MKSSRARIVAMAAMLAASAGFAVPTASAQTLDTVRVASSLALPLFVTHAPGEPYFIYIVLKQGRILRQDLRTGVQSDFIDLNPVVINVTSVNDERGLLGLAFHPGYATNGFFYVYYTSNSGTQVVARYRRSAVGVGDPATAQIVLEMADSFSNHNGGWMAFAPGDTNGLLYIATGDGGSGNDPLNSGQTRTSLLGKMLRIDIDGPDNVPGNADDDGFPADATRLYTIPPSNPWTAVGDVGLDEVWAWGLRNPWRNSFDRATGALYIGDVGQTAFEEHNFQPPSSTGGENYGWRCYEGNQITGLCGALPSGVTFPFFVYGRTLGVSTTAGYVYRGCAIPSLVGTYLLGDFGTARIWAVSGASASVAPTGTPTQIQADLSPPINGGSVSALASFGEDAFGEIYIVRHSSLSGEVFRIVPQGNAITDCNNNNVSDCGEISLGLVPDCNGNAVIDSCEIASNPALDCNGNAALDSCEIASNPALDCNANGALDSCEIASNPALDCDANAAIDACEIAADPSLDCNANGALDACEPQCAGDADRNGSVNFADIGAVLSTFGVDYGDCVLQVGDANFNGVVDFADLGQVLANFGSSCP